mmetsp:Transcript_26218/g.66543  ORF Transcript_26218/g.66543 Transcript_26218/m.66543 type:complete len:207 (+) Transcript_26218:569-1189(+)
MLIFCSSSLRRSSSSARRDEVEAEASICICLKSRSDFISSYLSESMPLALERCSVLRETTCSRRTISACARALLSSCSALVASKVSMSSVISLSRWKSSWYFCFFGSLASTRSLSSWLSWPRPLRTASWISRICRSASAISALSALTFCRSISFCCGSESCGPLSSSLSWPCCASSRATSSRSCTIRPRAGSCARACSISAQRSPK